jgi:hypothetical protein
MSDGQAIVVTYVAAAVFFLAGISAAFRRGCPAGGWAWWTAPLLVVAAVAWPLVFVFAIVDRLITKEPTS